MYAPWRSPRTDNASSNRKHKASKVPALRVWERWSTRPCRLPTTTPYLSMLSASAVVLVPIPVCASASLWPRASAMVVT